MLSNLVHSAHVALPTSVSAILSALPSRSFSMPTFTAHTPSLFATPAFPRFDSTTASAFPILDASTINEHDYLSVSDDWLDALTMHLEDNDPGFEDIEYTAGVLTVRVPESMTFVVNRQTPNRELWLSSPVRGPSHYGLTMKDGKAAWIDTKTGDTLRAVLEEDLGKLLGVPYPIVIE